MGELILVRHGETEWNVQARQQGHADSPLTKTGIAQAQALARRLARFRFLKLYSSDLGRALQTAQIIAAETGHGIEVDSRFREISLGIFQGLTKKECEARYPVEFAAEKAGGVDHSLPGGQSLRDYYNANSQFVEQLMSNHANDAIVAVTHGGFLSTVYRYVNRMPLESPRSFTLVNGSINIFQHNGKRFLLRVWGDVAHLEGLQVRDDE